MSIQNETLLEDEFNHLAVSLETEPRYFMHRDFQSQNIHFKDGCVKVIDFQTATQGLLQYDLASLLKDAYVGIDKKMRSDLVGFYMDVLKKEWKVDIDKEKFIMTFHLAGMQRNMQALGAFSFLGMQKGKKGFIKHIPSALCQLEEALFLFPDYPVLKETVLKAADIIKTNDLMTDKNSDG